jgi:hypothetical protein
VQGDQFRFLELLFGDKPDKDYILLFVLPDKVSYWYKAVGTAAVIVSDFQGKNVYVGVGTSPKNYGSRHRCKADDISGIVGMWADIDFAGAMHKKQNLPPTMEDGQKLLAEMGLQPTVVVNSGHGLQAWWLFKEPWVFDTPEERERAQAMCRRWSATLKARAGAHGWDADSVWDLARVLRVPGSVNVKDPDNPVPVRLIAMNESARYSEDDFEAVMIDEKATAEMGRRMAAAVTVDNSGPLNLRSDAQPPFDKFEILSSIEPKFMGSWNRTRKDFQDQSASSYDLSLATYALAAGWSDQETANLLIASRRKHVTVSSTMGPGVKINSLKLS